MTDKKEWFARCLNDRWLVVGNGIIIAQNLDKPTALKIAAVNEMEAALEACEAPIKVGDQNGLDFEAFAREVNRRQGIAGQALSKARGEGDE